MSVSRTGKQLVWDGHRSRASGKRSRKFAAQIKDNLDLQCKLLQNQFKRLRKEPAGKETK